MLCCLAGFSHAVAVYDSARLKLELYINGALVHSVMDTRAMPEFASPAYIGAAPDTALDFLYHGAIDEVAIYDHALTADRIALHFAIGHAGP